MTPGSCVPGVGPHGVVDADGRAGTCLRARTDRGRTPRSRWRRLPLQRLDRLPCRVLLPVRRLGDRGFAEAPRPARRHVPRSRSRVLGGSSAAPLLPNLHRTFHGEVRTLARRRCSSSVPCTPMVATFAARRISRLSDKACRSGQGRLAVVYVSHHRSR